MKINRLLQESQYPSMDDFLTVLVRECSDAIQNNVVLFRGMESSQRFGKWPIRTDRISLSRNYVGTVIFNEAFRVTHGITDVRNKSLFSSTSYADAKTYGEVFYVFPVNGSQLIFAPGVDDSLTYLNGWHAFTKSVKNLPDLTDQEMASVGELLDDIEISQGVSANASGLPRLVAALPPRVRECFESTVADQAKRVRDFKVMQTSEVNHLMLNAPGKLGTEVMIVGPAFYSLDPHEFYDRYNVYIDGMMDVLKDRIGK